MKLNWKIVLVFIVISIIIIALSYTIRYKREDWPQSYRSVVAIMVYDDSLKNYVKSSEIPKGSYTLNEEKSKCIAGGQISNYDSTNGTIMYSLESNDQCYIYFDVVKKIITFKIGSTPYNAYEGMTWEEWVNSDFNSIGAFFYLQYQYVFLDFHHVIAGIIPTDNIIEGMIYDVGIYGGSD